MTYFTLEEITPRQSVILYLQKMARIYNRKKKYALQEA